MQKFGFTWSLYGMALEWSFPCHNSAAECQSYLVVLIYKSSSSKYSQPRRIDRFGAVKHVGI